MASSSGAASPIGEAVARLPPSVARLRISGDANSASHVVTASGAARHRRPMSLSGSAAPIRIRCAVSDHSRSSSIASTLTRCCQRRPRRFHSTPRSEPPAMSAASGRAARIARQSSTERGRENPAVSAASIGGVGRARRSRKAPGGGGPTACDGVADGTVAGASAQIAGERHRVARAEPVGTVLLAEQAHHEPGRAVAALRSAGRGHRGLRVGEVAAIGQRLDGVDFPPGDGRHRHETAVHDPVGAAVAGGW